MSLSSRRFQESRRHSIRRRDFLRAACGAGVASSRLLKAAPPQRKVVVVTFGGGARDDETFAIQGQRNIPHLLNELIPQGTFFTQVVNRGILGHYVATASITTGVYETFNNFVAQPPAAPTMFEYYRKHLRRPARDSWVIAPSNGFERLGASGNRQFGAEYAAGVILPKRLLSSAVQGHSQLGLSDFEHLLQDSYETPVTSVGSSPADHELSLGNWPPP